MIIKHYHLTVRGWDKTGPNGEIPFATDIHVAAESLEVGIKKAKEIFPKKHWWVVSIQECITDHSSSIESMNKSMDLEKGSGDVRH